MRLSEIAQPTRSIDISLDEAAYSVDFWSKWWANTKTGEMISMPGREEHEEYFLENLGDFLDTHKSASRIAAYWESGSCEQLDDLLRIAARRGWVRALYDGNNGSLSVRTAASHLVSPRALSRIASTINREHPVTKIVFGIQQDDGQSVDHEITDAAKINAFMRTGRI